MKAQLSCLITLALLGASMVQFVDAAVCPEDTMRCKRGMGVRMCKRKNNDDKKDDKKQNKPQRNKISPEQLKNLLKAMNNEEKKVQEKVNKNKVKGIPVKNKKDW